MARSFKQMWCDTRRFFDLWNLIGLAVLIVLIGSQIFESIWPLQFGVSTQDGILILTGAYSFTAFNQMRETRWTRRQGEGMALRPHFVDELDGAGLTLFNFGEGAALDVRLQIVLRSSDGIGHFEVISDDDLVHLSEGDFLTISQDCLDKLNDPDSNVYTDPDATLEFYYTWEATTGRQYPSDVGEPKELPMDEIVDAYDSPRTVRLSEVRERLA